ncbi:MAG: thymidine phosphorylase [Pseudomonadota bacterium]
MDARQIIAKVRSARSLDHAEIDWFAKGLASGLVTDAQAGAFAMAVCLNGLGEPGRVALTEAMRDTGGHLDWTLDGPVVDKHSTGGVGDCTSLVLAPALAACGAYVPMISGRGLGHTGGTLDKLEAIPGLRTDLNAERFRAAVETVGCAIVGASGDIAPADRRLYAIRDVTATVDSIDLITASILSKKLAAGARALVLDVKIGSGAILPDPTEAEALARALTETANGAGCACRALLTDMNQPLATSLGNALEMQEVMTCLSDGRADGRLFKLSCALGGELLHMGGLADTPREGASRMAARIAEGYAATRFGKMVAAMGGPVDFIDNWANRLPAAPVVIDAAADRAGIVDAIDGAALGRLVVDLGGGRRVETDRVDPSVGLSAVVSLGTHVEPGARLARIHAADRHDAEAAVGAVRAAISVSEDFDRAPELIHGRIA